jgi:hypothetical protein
MFDRQPHGAHASQPRAAQQADCSAIVQDQRTQIKICTGAAQDQIRRLNNAVSGIGSSLHAENSLDHFHVPE